MPIAQLLSSAIETLLNQLLKLDPVSERKLKKLDGKSLQLRVKELPWPLLFHFSENISVLIVLPDDLIENEVSCKIELDLETLPQLQDSSKLTQLIQQKKLLLNGDIYVAQCFSSLLQELDIDWEEQLSVYTGDALAHQTFSTVKSAIAHGKDNLEHARAVWSERLTKDGAIGVKQQELNEFSEQVNKLRSASERLHARLSMIEKTHKV
jgi:ubiquinone biosynthesis protein UbiJ